MEKIWLGVLLLIIFIFTGCNIWISTKGKRKHTKKQSEIVQHLHISTLSLLNEKMEIIKEWDIQGKSSLLIGRIAGNEPDEIDLSNVAEATLISKEHAVLNYAGGEWYVEDLDSENGTRVQRAGEAEILKLTGCRPYRLERGDIIYIANTPLKVA